MIFRQKNAFFLQPELKQDALLHLAEQTELLRRRRAGFMLYNIHPIVQPLPIVSDTEVNKRLCLPCERGRSLLIWLLCFRDGFAHLDKRRERAIVEKRP